MTNPTPKTIRDQNDRFRKGDASIPGQILMTSGLSALLQDQNRTPLEIIEMVRNYDDFGEDNDPHKEHDFGAFDLSGTKIFWKIDYYDPQIQYGSEDPSDPSKTFRVLTVFLASEY